jgi:hypothetical protein
MEGESMRTPTYLNLRIGAPKRLAYLKEANPTDWRKARHWRFKSWEAAYCILSQGFNGTDAHKVPIWYEHGGGSFRHERTYSDVISHNRHTAWYTDADCSDTCTGIIARLTHGRFIAGYLMSMNDERVWFDNIFHDQKEAAQMADEHARVVAEHEQEYDQRWQEANQIGEKMDDAKKRRTECLILARSYALDSPFRNEYRGEAAELKTKISDWRWELTHSYKDISL